MAGSKGDYLEIAVLDHVLGGPDYTRPGTVYVALFTSAPADSGGGTEVTGGAYARASVTNNSTNWPGASGTTATKANGTTISFPTATAAWGTVVAFAIFDAASAGNLLFWGTLTLSKIVGIGDTLAFAAGAITITED